MFYMPICSGLILYKSPYFFWNDNFSFIYIHQHTESVYSKKDPTNLSGYLRQIVFTIDIYKKKIPILANLI